MVTSLFTSSAPLSFRTLKRRSGLKSRVLFGVLEDAIAKKLVRRVRPIEVGSGKYDAGQKDEVGLKATEADTKKQKNQVRHRNFNVFALR